MHQKRVKTGLSQMPEIKIKMKQNCDDKHSFDNNQVVSETNTFQFYKSPSLHLRNQHG